MRPQTRVAPSAIGQGLFAERDYQAGDLIMILRGPRFGRQDPLHETPDGANLLQTGFRSYILLGSPGVYANHSCDPNAGIMENRRLVAIRAIETGEEIRYDYSTTMDEDYWTMDCLCGTESCRGVVTDFRYLPRSLRERYLDLGIVQRFIARRYRQTGPTGSG